MILFVYGALILLQILLLIGCVKKQSRPLWSLLFLSELCALTGAVYLSYYYDALPGVGMMPGLTWFAETLYSMAAAVVYLCMLIASVLTCAVMKLKKQNNGENK